MPADAPWRCAIHATEATERTDRGAPTLNESDGVQAAVDARREVASEDPLTLTRTPVSISYSSNSEPMLGIGHCRRVRFI